MIRTLTTIVGFATMALAPAIPALAAEHQVAMVNRDSEGRNMQFEPAFLEIAPGDTVTFVVQDRGHNSEALPNAIPEGAEPWKGKIDEEITVTFTVEGYYAFKCLPHVAMGMVGLIQVGEPGAPDAALAEGIPGNGKVRMEELIAQAKGQ